MAKAYHWNAEKNEKLLRERGLSFEMAVEAIARGNFAADEPHPDPIKYPHQRLLFVAIGDYVCDAPYVLNENVCFLKTVDRSRKANCRKTGENDGTA